MNLAASRIFPLMKKFFAVVLFWSLLGVAFSRAQQPGNIPPNLPTPPIQTGGEIAARAAIEVWLGLVDDGQFDRSWDNAAGAVQKAVSKEQWVKVFSENRPKLGKLQTRILRDTRASTRLPGAPEGQYVVAQYDTAFEHKRGVETITSMLDPSGQWKVSGYFFK